MANVLYLVHRLPYPPNKGDKVRSYHLLECLAAKHRVYLGTIVDDDDDLVHIDAVRRYCADIHVARIRPRLARLRSLGALLRGEALTVAYYRDAGLHAFVRAAVREAAIRDAVVFSSAMTQYVTDMPQLRLLLDCVDVDSMKWAQYAESHRWPLSALYRREARRLLAHETAGVERAERAFFVTEAEAQLFRKLAPACAEKVAAVGNGVDTVYFSPDHALPSPFAPEEKAIVFTGAMDYWPNVDAARWFAGDVLPRLRANWPMVRFYVVGMKPAAAARRLAASDVVVTGKVPDVRPYLANAAVVVAPLRIARGVQNKILEAMAMAKAVVTSDACAASIDARRGRELMAAADAAGFAERVDALLRDPGLAATVGRAARERVLARYGWETSLSRIARMVGGAAAAGDVPPFVPSDVASHAQA